MFYDFNIPCPQQPEQADIARLQHIIARISSFQCATVAFNLTVPELQRNVKITPTFKWLESFSNVKQLGRVTLVVDDAKKNYLLSGGTPLHSHIDILAVRPTTTDVCKHACQSYEVDLISIDLAKSRVSPGYVSARVAIDRGIFFEICYSQCYRDPQRRSMFFHNVKRLVEVTRGDHLIFSSEALQALEIRRTEDLRILGLLFGLTEPQAIASCGSNYQRLLRRAETRRSTINAAISVEEKDQKRKADDSLNDTVTKLKKQKK